MNEFTDFKTYKMKNQKTYQYVFDYFSEQILSGEFKITRFCQKEKSQRN